MAAVFLIEPRPYDHPDVIRLVDELQAEYVTRYGGPDETPIEPGEFDPPDGRFFVGLLDGDPVVSGAWRRLADQRAEIKRMYVAARARRLGLARLMLAELESTLAAEGFDEVVLMTGTAQPEAMRLYESSGYRTRAAYGIYACAPDARFYRKVLSGVRGRAELADRGSGRVP